MRWASDSRRALLRLQNSYTPPEDPRLRVLVAAMARADRQAGNVVLSAFARPRGERGKGGGSVAQLKQLLVLPVGDRCNLACRYCYEHGRRADRVLAHQVMSIGTLERILHNVLTHVGRPFALTFHGGEPLLAGRDFFRRAGEVARSYDGGDQVRLGVQTNATLIDCEWAELFRDHNFGVGVSLDGPPDVHDSQRVTASGRGTYAATLRGMDELRAAGVPFGTIAVIGAEQTARPWAAAELFEHFQGLGLSSFDVHPAYSGAIHTAAANVTPEAYARFMIDLFECWLAAGNPGVRIGFIEHVFQGMTGHGPFVCYLSGGCVSVMGVAADGQAVPCTRPFDSRYRFGDLSARPLPELLGRPAFRDFRRREAFGRKLTEDCEWAALCGGGCPHERTGDRGQDIAGANVFCTCRSDSGGGYPAIFSHIVTRVGGLLAAAEAQPVRTHLAEPSLK